MQFRTLGQTGVEVSVLSYGASALGSVFRDIRTEEGVRTVHEAVERGVNLIDVSPYYGLTKAETVLGQALAELPRDRYLLSSKAGRYGVDHFDFSEQRIIRSVEESLGRLGTDYLDILLLHDIEFVPFSQIEEGFAALDRLKEQGKIRFHGVSGLPLAALEKALRAKSLDVVLSYCHYSLNDNALLELLPFIEQRGTGLINASALSMGLLGTRGTADWHPASDEVKAVCRQAALFCEQQGTPIAKLAMQYSTSHPDIPTTLVSTANPDNMKQNIEWLEEPLDEQLLREVLDILAPVHNRTWRSGIAEYNEQLQM